eukprot:TRINITY_DN2564_c0_g2_i1.p2 TRINITY_DN2564_c0_g2~~TRINITY_DN2564_c0_g2_i1.p2  ORF type:complete len:167 (+),score=34.07 TRINITY_DN2564_c0_g2_i1:473-973(+)
MMQSVALPVRKDFIAVQDLCHATLLACTALRVGGQRAALLGERPILVTKGETWRMDQLEEFLAAHCEREAVRPSPALLAAVAATSAAVTYCSAPFGMAPALPTHQALQASRLEQTFDNRCARRLLGYSPAWQLQVAIGCALAEWRRGMRDSAIILQGDVDQSAGVL